MVFRLVRYTCKLNIIGKCRGLRRCVSRKFLLTAEGPEMVTSSQFAPLGSR